MKRELKPEQKEQFARDWNDLSYTEICRKYGVQRDLTRRWAKEMGLKYPKPPVSKGGGRISDVEIKSLAKKVLTFDDVDGRSNPKVASLLEELRIVTYSGSLKKEIDDKTSELLHKIFIEYLLASASWGHILENAVSLKKIMLYEKRVTRETQESDEIDETTLRNLKKNFSKEIMRDMESYMTDVEKRFFRTIVDRITKRALAERKKQQDVTQQQAINDGIIDAETVES